MTDKYKNLRDALDAEPTDDKWICAHYSPKTLGVGINGGPALFMVREGSYTNINDVREIVRNLLIVRREARALLAERDELERALVISGKVSKRLMDELAVVVAERDALREALSACRNYISDNRESRAAAELAQMIDAALTQHQGERHGDQ